VPAMRLEVRTARYRMAPYTAMRKTTVYLTELEAEGLQRMAARTGRSQAELVREGVRLVIEQAPPRTFHSMGKGQASSEGRPRWDADALYEKAFGRR
jgi:ribbon-helix-helix CopG family protein